MAFLAVEVGIDSHVVPATFTNYPIKGYYQIVRHDLMLTFRPHAR